MNRKALIAEFIGTFALIFIGVGAIAADFLSGSESGLAGVALAHGLTIAVMVSATAAISGGHLNPAVTIGLFFTKKIDAVNAIGYIIVQCLGAIAAAFLVKMCVPAAAFDEINMGVPALTEGVTPGMGLIIEMVLTFFLVFVVYGTAVDKRAPKMGGLFIGLTIVLGILMGGPLTGAAINPARYFGPAVIAGDFSNLWLYWLGPVLGGILAAVTYQKCLE